MLIFIASALTSLVKKREFLDKAHELGLILGQMVVLQNATGHGFRPEVDRNIFDALQFLNKIAINSSKTAHDYVLELAESPDEKRLVKLVKEVMKTQFKDKTQLDYLKSLPFDDLEDYTAEAAAYLIIANEMQMLGSRGSASTNQEPMPHKDPEPNSPVDSSQKQTQPLAESPVDDFDEDIPF